MGLILWLIRRPTLWAFVAGVVLTLGLQHWPSQPAVTIIAPATPHAATVTYVTQLTGAVERELDASLASAGLRAEVRQLALRVSTLSTAIGELRSSGGGPTTTIVREVPGATTTVTVPGSVHFQDFRLTFDAASGQARYDLHQRFEVHHATGWNKTGVPLSLLSMFELGPGEQKTEIPLTAKTVVIDERQTKWRWSPTLQAGYAWSAATMAGPRIAPATGTHGALIGLQLLKRGRSVAAENCTMAVLEPAVLVAGKAVSVGMVPVAWNIAALPGIPLKDVWAGLFLGYEWQAKRLRLGLSLMASF